MITEKIIKWLCRRRYQTFQEALKNPQKSQLLLREQLFKDLLKSEYGKFLGVKRWEEIPIVNYQDIAKWIESEKLTHSSVKFTIETSGSSCCSKTIPYTAQLKHSFLSLFKIWAYDLLKNMLKPGIGKIFMSLSPPSDSGLKDDTQFLNGLLKKILQPYLILPPNEPENYLENTARILLSEKDLGIISIWNPTYLLQILETIEKNSKGPMDWKLIWPKLQLISCWTDGWAFDQSQALKERFPHMILQGKGLLATEAPMTVPLTNAIAPVPLIDEVYFEFEDGSGNIATIEQVCAGEIYELIISQKGGLIRYRIGDKVKVSGYYLNTPCLTFVGRAGQVCDMVGEKLDSFTVEGILRDVFKQKVVQPFSCLFIPLTNPAITSY